MRPSSLAARTTMSPVFCSTSMSCRNPNRVIPAIRPTVVGLRDRCSSSARKEMSIGFVNVAAMPYWCSRSRRSGVIRCPVITATGSATPRSSRWPSSVRPSITGICRSVRMASTCWPSSSSSACCPFSAGSTAKTPVRFSARARESRTNSSSSTSNRLVVVIGACGITIGTPGSARKVVRVWPPESDSAAPRLRPILRSGGHNDRTQQNDAEPPHRGGPPGPGAHQTGGRRRATPRRLHDRRLARRPAARPCHRVVRQSGDLGGYRWGVKRKALLLEGERAAVLGAERRVLASFVGTLGDSSRAAVPRPVGHTSLFAPGQVVAGRYEIIDLLGSGGMGVVYRARDRELDEVVALKALRPDGTTADPHAVERFRRELRLARRVSHPNVVRTHDIGEASGYRFITIEHVEGRSLD